VLNFLTPHGKWSIHSTYSDNLRMLTLSRGGQVVWLNPEDRAGGRDRDNEEIEVFNANGVVVCRAIVSSRIPKGRRSCTTRRSGPSNIKKSKRADDGGACTTASPASVSSRR